MMSMVSRPARLQIARAAANPVTNAFSMYGTGVSQRTHDAFVPERRDRCRARVRCVVARRDQVRTHVCAQSAEGDEVLAVHVRRNCAGWPSVTRDARDERRAERVRGDESDSTRCIERRHVDLRTVLLRPGGVPFHSVSVPFCIGVPSTGASLLTPREGGTVLYRVLAEHLETFLERIPAHQRKRANLKRLGTSVYAAQSHDHRLHAQPAGLLTLTAHTISLDLLSLLETGQSHARQVTGKHREGSPGSPP
jgi:hypothetical protein